MPMSNKSSINFNKFSIESLKNLTIAQVNHILTDALELFKMTLLVQSF
jgi:hypothetical protein